MAVQQLETIRRNHLRLAEPALEAEPGDADRGYSAHNLLTPLADAMQAALRFREVCRKLQDKTTRHERRWAVPELFSFDKAWQSHLDSLRPQRISYLTSHGATVAQQAPADADAWNSLDALIDAALPTLFGSVEARRVARVIPGLVAGAKALAADHEGAGRLAAVLEVVDDMVFTVRHPATARTWRVCVNGIEDNFHLHVLLVDALLRDEPIYRYDARVVAAYRGLPLTDEPLTVLARFGMYSVGAVQPDGHLPQGLAGSDFWIWGNQSPKNIPMQQGERIVYWGELPYPIEWDLERRFPTLRAEVELLETAALSPAETVLAA